MLLRSTLFVESDSISCLQVPVCGACIANGEKHHTHALISAKAAAGDAKAAVEGYVKAAQSFAREAEGHSNALSSKLQGSALCSSEATAVLHEILLADCCFVLRSQRWT